MESALVILSAWHLALVPVVVGLVSAVKMVGLPSKWAALVAIVLGVLLSWIIPGAATLFSVVVGGIAVGLAASGLYSGAKATFNG